MTCENNTPTNDVYTEILCNWHSLNDPVGRVFDNQHGDVDTCCEPGVLLLFRLLVGIKVTTQGEYVPAAQQDEYLDEYS